jgi:hypothetical protein
MLCSLKFPKLTCLTATEKCHIVAILVCVLEHFEPAIYKTVTCQVPGLIISTESTLRKGMKLGDFMTCKTVMVNEFFY